MGIFGIPLQALLGQLLLGLVNGSFYAMLSLGLAVIFGLLGIVNFAHGALYMIGAYVAWLGLETFGLNYWAALIVSPLVVGALGLVVERTLLKQLYKIDPIYGLLLTFGLSLIAEGIATYDGREAYGHLGRIYKQMYVDALKPPAPEEREEKEPVDRALLQLYLDRAFGAYMHVWHNMKTPETAWHGINAVAIASMMRMNRPNMRETLSPAPVLSTTRARYEPFAASRIEAIRACCFWLCVLSLAFSIAELMAITRLSSGNTAMPCPKIPCAV